MTVEILHSGVSICELRNDGYLVSRLYVGYSKSEAMKEFREEFPKED